MHSLHHQKWNNITQTIHSDNHQCNYQGQYITQQRQNVSYKQKSPSVLNNLYALNRGLSIIREVFRISDKMQSPHPSHIRIKRISYCLKIDPVFRRP